MPMKSTNFVATSQSGTRNSSISTTPMLNAAEMSVIVSADSSVEGGQKAQPSVDLLDWRSASSGGTIKRLKAKISSRGTSMYATTKKRSNLAVSKRVSPASVCSTASTGQTANQRSTTSAVAEPGLMRSATSGDISVFVDSQLHHTDMEAGVSSFKVSAQDADKLLYGPRHSSVSSAKQSDLAQEAAAAIATKETNAATLNIPKSPPAGSKSEQAHTMSMRAPAKPARSSFSSFKEPPVLPSQSFMTMVDAIDVPSATDPASPTACDIDNLSPIQQRVDFFSS